MYPEMSYNSGAMSGNRFYKIIPRLFRAPLKNSYFLFGARGTGKSTLLELLYGIKSKPSRQNLYIDLLDPLIEEDYQKNPNRLKEILAESSHPKRVIIDEIQKVPELLDVVQSKIEEHKGIQFVMTGSSARKLKRGRANLLGGRAFSMHLHPYTHLEAPDGEDLESMLTWGTLPQIYKYRTPEDKGRFLRTYTQMYLKEEIQLEQLARQLSRFRQFLELSAQCNGEIMNFANIGNQSGLDEKTIARYFEILSDTMLCHFLEPYDESVRVRQSQKPKFYLFDTGIFRHLLQFTGNKLVPGSSEYGRVFEQFIICECFRLNDYYERDFRFYYLRTKDGAEIDLIIKKNARTKILIEIKSTNSVNDSHARHLISLSRVVNHKEKWILCTEKRARKTKDGIRILPWRQGLAELFD